MTVKINRLPFGRRLWRSRDWKRRNKDLMVQLAAWDLELRSPALIRSLLGLDRADLDFLNLLARLPDGLHPAQFQKNAPGHQAHLADLGLIRLTWPRLRLALTDAGRLLLTLDKQP